MPKLTRRRFLGTVGALTPALMAGGRSDAAPPQKPSFIVIYADDQGYGDLGCYGATKFKTPNIDRMATEGTRFSDFYVTAPVCTPTRSSLMTGCYPRRVGMHQHVLFPNSTKGLNPSEVTLAEVLKPQGYATACIGKWHLGYQKQFLPTSQGFDYYFGIPFSNDMWLPPDMDYAPDAKLPADLSDEVRRKGERKRNSVPLMRNDKVIEYPADQATLTERYTEEAIGFITANKDRPFFLYLPHTMPHYPLHISERFKGKSGAGLFGDVIECIDWSVGQILATLKKLGIDEKTLVVYTSDNGPAAGSAGPLRGKKGSTWEGGMREPCIVRWPGQVPAGAECREVATIMDLLPTFARLAGTEAPKDRIIDGKDIWPLLAGQPGAKSPYDAFFYHTAQGQLAAVRQGEWKLHVVAPGGRGKGGTPAAGQALLFDLSADVGETKDVAAAHGDVVARLTELFRRFDADLQAHLRSPGRV